MSQAVLSTLHSKSHFLFTAILQGSYYYYPHFTNEVTEAQRGYSLPVSHAFTVSCWQAIEDIIASYFWAWINLKKDH
jgi:hypothetical protein